jgi:hypothetical protein
MGAYFMQAELWAKDLPPTGKQEGRWIELRGAGVDLIFGALILLQAMLSSRHSASYRKPVVANQTTPIGNTLQL